MSPLQRVVRLKSAEGRGEHRGVAVEPRKKGRPTTVAPGGEKGTGGSRMDDPEDGCWDAVNDGAMSVAETPPDAVRGRPCWP